MWQQHKYQVEREKKKLTKDDISTPQNFRHIAHVGLSRSDNNFTLWNELLQTNGNMTTDRETLDGEDRNCIEADELRTSHFVSSNERHSRRNLERHSLPAPPPPPPSPLKQPSSSSSTHNISTLASTSDDEANSLPSSPLNFLQTGSEDISGHPESCSCSNGCSDICGRQHALHAYSAASTAKPEEEAVDSSMCKPVHASPAPEVSVSTQPDVRSQSIDISDRASENRSTTTFRRAAPPPPTPMTKATLMDDAPGTTISPSPKAKGPLPPCPIEPNRNPYSKSRALTSASEQHALHADSSDSTAKPEEEPVVSSISKPVHASSAPEVSVSTQPDIRSQSRDISEGASENKSTTTLRRAAPPTPTPVTKATLMDHAPGTTIPPIPKAKGPLPPCPIGPYRSPYSKPRALTSASDDSEQSSTDQSSLKTVGTSEPTENLHHKDPSAMSVSSIFKPQRQNPLKRPAPPPPSQVSQLSLDLPDGDSAVGPKDTTLKGDDYRSSATETKDEKRLPTTSEFRKDNSTISTDDDNVEISSIQDFIQKNKISERDLLAFVMHHGGADAVKEHRKTRGSHRSINDTIRDFATKKSVQESLYEDSCAQNTETTREDEMEEEQLKPRPIPLPRTRRNVTEEIS